ncbi:type I secretion system permease/ATPase [Piscinibacter gummiphilus]|uniref:Cyclolysin secretion/processing ATP-binding protein CyaB n=1 Tax=Piscinibacter gummiphilus TaxID=946333 RepID=A0A1W6L814_9BURK|nr:type I secretion system permease/ATPase [Piscinibacter gummiphilus]ARN20288.1 ABC transporter [Piscinibacter gummiphilus]ATU64960.1 type I secretion system permease/ATPase [Piscinibacter gummiphilus]GLS96404.1 ABC transporter [Piscinibacter gummiphilus]
MTAQQGQQGPTHPATPGGSAPPPSATAVPPVTADAATQRLREDLIHPDPLLDCLVEVCRLTGRAASRASLSAGLPLGASGKARLTLELAERAAARAGMSAKLQRLALADIDTAALPAILILKDSQACVLLGWNADHTEARVLLPETGQGSVGIGRDALAERFTGVVLFVRPHFRFDARTPEVRSVRNKHWFWSAVLEQRFVYRDVLWAALLVNFFALVFPLFSMNVYDRVVPNNAIETLWALSVGVVLIMCADLFMRLLRSHFVDEASARIDVQISARLMERVLGMRLENRPESVGSFASNLRGFEQVRDFIASSTVTALIDLPFALLFIIVLAWISPWLAVPVLVAFAVILVMGYVLQHRLHELSQTTYQASAQRNATLIESLTGIETIKSLGAEGVIQGRWERANVFLSRTNVRMRALSSTASYTTGWLTQAVTISIVIIGVHLIGLRDLTMGALIASSMLAGRALGPAGQIVALLMQYQGARTAMESLDKIMERPVERPADENFIQRPQLRGDIEFRNVKFSYPGRQDVALEGLSFKVAAGERVALIGRVGSGKSTIERLIMGLYQPTEGAVLIDGIDLRQLDPADVRRNLGYVSQDVTLFYGTLRDNITFGLPYADDSAVVAAAELAGMTSFIYRHPRGFDMPVGERGESLSGGQRQGIGLARAVLHNAPILLLDEPTSAMDFSTEAQITQNITKFAENKTVVLVTHRTSLLAMVNRVIVIDGGKIVADGPRDRIMEALSTGRIARAA